MNTYEEAVAWVEGLLPHGIKPGLERIKKMLEVLGNPQKDSCFIHVGGTNGKGSTVAFLRSILLEADYHVGTYTSPYMEHFSERISFDGAAISDDDFIWLANELKPLVEEIAQTNLGSPTEFEVLTTMAYVYFGKMVKPDIVLVEVGLGGREDATNVITPIVSLITNVGYDHMQMLGNTISEISCQKAGIIKENVPIITTAEKEEALTAIRTEAQEKSAPFYELGKDFYYQLLMKNNKEQSFWYLSSAGEQIKFTIRLQGEHQIKNALLAIKAIKLLEQKSEFKVLHKDLISGLLKAHWPGRFEVVKDEPLIVIDGAHNQEGLSALVNTLTDLYDDKHIHVLFAATMEKDVEQLLRPLYPIINTLCFTTFNHPRAAGFNVMHDNSTFKHKDKEESWKCAIDKYIETLKANDLLVVTGSLYFISEVRAYFYQ